MKTILANGTTYKMGRNPVVAMGPHFRLRNYLKLGIPAPPASVNYASPAQAELGNIYLNDSLGDCVIACLGHLGGVFLGNAGGKLYLTSDQIISLYSAIGGYIPGDPNSDQGADVQTAMNYWMRHGLLPGQKYPHKIKAWMSVDPTNVQEMQTAIWLFENLVFGLNLPDAWVNPFPSANGFVWDVAGAPDQNNGHCICGVGFGSSGYSHKGIEIATWGMLGNLTYDAIAKYLPHSAGGELYCVLSQEILDKAKLTAPAGISWDQLQADFASMGVA